MNLSLSASKIKGAGHGVWTDAVVPKSSLFGPFEGTVQPFTDVDRDLVTGYRWLVSWLAVRF